MWREIDELRRQFLRRFNELWEQVENEIEALIEEASSMPSIKIAPEEPLHTIRELEDHYEIIIDLPYVDETSIQINAYNQVLEVKAKLKRVLKCREAGYRIYSGEIREYRKRVKLPPDADVSRLTYKLVCGNRLLIIVPKELG